MATPFFRGNYGSALSQVDTRPILEAGRARGQMFAGLGKEVGGMIKEYGLNKEKRRKEEDTAMGTLAGFSPEELMQIGQDNPKLGKAIERATTESATPRDFQLINASAAPIVAGKMRQLQTDATSALTRSRNLANDFAEETNQYRANVIKDQSILSRLNKKLTQELDPKKRELLGKQIDETIADLSLRPKERREREMQLRDKQARRAVDPVSGQASDARKLRKFQLSALERADSIESLVAATLGLEQMAEMKIEDMKTLSETNKAKLESTKAVTSYYKAKGIADLLTAANKNSPSFSDRFKPLVEMTGKILSTNVKVPNSNKRVTFNDYLELHEEDSRKYPLNGLAGDLNAQLLSLESQTQNVLRAQTVPVAVPDETVTPSEKSASELIARDLIPPMLNPAQEQGALNIAGNITSAIPQVISDEALEQLAQEFLDKTNPDAAKILQTPRGQEAFQRLMQKRQASGLGRGAIGI